VAEVRASTGLLLAGGMVVVLVGVVSRPRAGGVTGRRIEDAVAPTFANLIRLQRSILGMPTVDVAALRASADCHKVGAPRDTRGAGDWTCTLLWLTPGQRAPAHDTYDVTVTADGCYAATADGSEAHIGGPTLPTRDGKTTTNLLYTFEGCFDTTGPVTFP
jgi:hypothetical protein